MEQVRFLPAGDSALCVEFGSAIDPQINAKVQHLAENLTKKPIRGVMESIPTFRSLLVCYDPCIIGFAKLVSRLEKRLGALESAQQTQRRVVYIPVLYGGETGEDMGNVSAHTGLSEAQIVAMHSETEYLIYMLGFLPGFAYLGGMNPKLNTPRLKSPRKSIPAGSVGIGGEQTGIYPLASPGGWQLIGRTPVKPYDAYRERPILYSAGDYIKFEPVDSAEYSRIEALVRDGGYECRVVNK